MSESDRPISIVVGLPAEVTKQLEKHFDQKSLETRPAKWDQNKQLTYVMAESVIRRLNEAFQHCWNFQILSWEWNTSAGKVLCHSRLTAKMFVKDPDSNYHLVETYRDGIGDCDLRMKNGAYLDPGLDLKGAITDSLKLAAKLFGVALYLYEDKGNIAANDPRREKATDFQIKRIDEYFLSCGISTKEWCSQYKIPAPADLPADIAEQLLSGNHPDVQWCERTHGKKINQGIKSSSA